jgi:hypothetical protein
MSVGRGRPSVGELERAHQLEQQALARARMTSDVRAQRQWQDVADSWRTRIVLLKRQMEASADEMAHVPRLLEHLTETEGHIRADRARVERQRERVAQLSEKSEPAEDAQRLLEQYEEQLALRTDRREFLRAEIRKLADRPDEP